MKNSAQKQEKSSEFMYNMIIFFSFSAPTKKKNEKKTREKLCSR